MPRFSFAPRAVLLAALLAAAPAASAPVQPSERVERAEPVPKRLQGLDVTEHLEGPIPKDLGFRDQSGREVMLGEYFDGKVPVVLTLNYSGCPMLCSMQLTAFTNSLKQLEFTAGKEFRVVTVSLDPEETPDVAHKTQNRYLSQYGRPGAKDGWSFLTGSEANIKALAAAMGFGYAYNEAREEYVHPAAIAVTTPEGKIARYLYGLDFPENTLRLALVESSQGRIGTSIDRLILYCFHYDSSEGRYAPVARNIMKLGGGVTVVLLGGLVLVLSRAGSRRKR
jgi:protein SCO1/2